MWACGTSTGYSKHFKVPGSGPWELLGGQTFETNLQAGGPCNNCTPPWVITENECTGGSYESGFWDTGDGVCHYDYYTPILVPLSNKRNIKLTGIEEGVYFDMDGDGLLERTGWTDPKSRYAFLAIDHNGNGTIDSGKELIGGHTANGASNGFAALQVLNRMLGAAEDVAYIEVGQPLYGRLLL